MRRILFTLLVAVMASSAGCGGSPKHAKNANDSADTLDTPREDNDLSSDDVEQSDRKKSDDDKTSDEKKIDSSNPKNNPDPAFKEGGSVNDAINAVPQGLPRENMEQEVLDRPLLDTALYAPCKIGTAHHFEIKFAVWNGKIVGMDIKSTPKSEKLDACVRERAMTVTWREKTKSLNISTVMF